MDDRRNAHDDDHGAQSLGRQPSPGPSAEHPADQRAAGDQARRTPGDVGGKYEHDSGDEVDQPGQDDLYRVQALKIVGDRQAQDGQDQDALGGAEVPAVDASGEHATVASGPALA